MNGFSLQKSFPKADRKDRPTIGIPAVEVWRMPYDEWKKKNKQTLKLPYACFDAETFKHFHQPNMFACVIVDVDADGKLDGIIGGKFILDDDGNRMLDHNGKYMWESDPSSYPKVWNRCDKHKKTKNSNAMRKCCDCTQKSVKPKNIGKYWSKNDPKKSYIRMTKMWCWADEFVENMVPVFMQLGVKKVYAHNATVDIIAMLSVAEPDLAHPLEKFVQTNPNDRSRILLKGSGILSCKIDVAPYYNRHAKKAWKQKVYDYNERKMVWSEEYDIEFLDSYSLLPLPLASLGKAVGYPKGETPELFKQEEIRYMEITTDMVRYCIQDCEVLFLSMLQFWQGVKALGYHGTTLPLTSGTLGSQMIAYDNIKGAKGTDRGVLYEKKEKSWKYMAIVNQPDLDDICRKAMVGGRTQVFHSDLYEGTAYGIDANSMYPAQMTNTNLFYPNFKEMVGIKNKADLEECVSVGEGAIYCHWQRPADDHIGMFSAIKPTGGLDWTLTKGTRWMTFPEYRHAIMRGYTMTPKKCPETGYYAIAMPRLDYNPFACVKKWYDLRKEMKAKGDPNEFAVKILLNAGGFGKFVERNQDMFLVEEQEATGLPMFNKGQWSFTEVSSNDEEGIIYGYMKEHDGNHNPLFKRADTTANIMGAYITAYARMNLYEIAREIGAEHLLYCDTDSWKHTNADVICPSSGDELGQWKLEQIYDVWESVAPKQYRYHAVWDEDKGDTDTWKARVKGCSLKNVNAETLDLRGEVSFTRVVGLKESWRSGTKAGSWIDVQKQLAKSLNKDKKKEVET